MQCKDTKNVGQFQIFVQQIVQHIEIIMKKRENKMK